MYLYHSNLVYLVFAAAHGQRQEPVEETFLLAAADVDHVTCEDAVQSAAVPDGGQLSSYYTVFILLHYRLMVYNII